MRKTLIAAVAVVACCSMASVSPLMAQMPMPEMGDTRGKMPTPEDMKAAGERFLKSSYSGNMLHVKASEYALSQVNDPKVRALAEQLIKDHTMANEKLAAVAKQKGVELPTDLLPPQKTMLESAMMVKGEMFAATYLFNMASLHVHDILEFSHVASESKDAEIKAFAKEALPVLKAHLKMIKPMAEMKADLTGTMEGM